MITPIGVYTTNGMEFGPTPSGKKYLCAIWHRTSGSSGYKSKWIIPEVQEYAIFYQADTDDWKDPAGHYWGLKVGGEIIGEHEERIAKFPAPQNSHDIWHGYPVITGKDKPPKKLINLWKEQALISKALAKRIKDGKV